jgi:protein N-terminal methyltransferase
MGFDTLGQQYESIDEMWKVEVEGHKSSLFNTVGNKQDWYQKGEQYWEKVPATLDGVLGGLGHLDKLDITDSLRFFEKMRSQNIIKNWDRA